SYPTHITRVGTCYPRYKLSQVCQRNLHLMNDRYQVTYNHQIVYYGPFRDSSSQINGGSKKLKTDGIIGGNSRDIAQPGEGRSPKNGNRARQFRGDGRSAKMTQHFPIRRVQVSQLYEKTGNADGDCRASFFGARNTIADTAGPVRLRSKLILKLKLKLYLKLKMKLELKDSNSN
ncbi:unnamed protein product, partial [Nesidiocoris tenuis]